MRAEGQRSGDVERMQARAGQSCALENVEPADDLAQHLWDGALKLLE
jgi:nitronate monooxygenase